MLDLALALVWTPLGIASLLVWTPLGIASLLAVAAAIAAAVYLPRLAIPLVCMAVILAGAAYVSALQADLGTARRERDEAKAAAETAARGTKAVEGVAAKAAERSRASRSTRDRILSAPASDDGPVAPVLRQVLEGGR